jgi:outer membrane protein
MKRIIALTLVLIALAGSVSAQNKVNKFGYINTLELLSLMPEIQPADSALEKYATELDALYNKMLMEYQAKITELDKTVATMSEDMKQIKAQELADMEKRIGQFEQSSSEKLGKKKQTLYEPILDKADKAIREVAKENGFTYIFDSSVGAIIFADESDDILPLVKAKLGLKDAPIPAGN